MPPGRLMPMQTEGMLLGHGGMRDGGHLYMQTNETRNFVVHTATGGAGSGGYNPSDNWLTADGAYLYQLYGHASKLVGYRTHPDGSLEEITSIAIPYNSSQGLAGF